MYARESADPSSGARFHARYLWGITVVTGIGLWILPMLSSFWLDETVTWWVIEGDLETTIRRAFEYQQSPFYYVIAWGARMTFGSSEFAVRLPSLVFAACAGWLLFRLAARLHDREVARLVVLAFVASPWMAYAASDARPYALGVLSIIAAGLALVRWLDEGKRRDGVWVAIACAASIWAHYLFGITVVALLAWGAYRVARTPTPVTWRAFGSAIAGTAVLSAPLISHLLSLWERAESLTIPGHPTLEWLMTYLVRPAAVGGLLLGVIVARLMGPLRGDVPPARGNAWALWATWAAAAPVGLFVLAAVSPLEFLTPRYSASAIPALAALVGLVIASLHPAVARRVTASVMALVAVIALTGTLKFGEGWREAAAFVRDHAGRDTPILLRAGLIESDQPSWVADPKRSQYLTAPAAAYDFGADVVPMPYVVDEAAKRYFEALIDTRLADLDRFLLVTRDRGFHGTEIWLDGRLESEGFESREVGSFGAVFVVEYARSSEGS